MKKSFYLIIILFLSHSLLAQRNEDFKEGYALRGNDTIYCKLFLKTEYALPSRSLICRIGDEETTFYPGGPITGFGIEEDGKQIHYGTVEVERSVGDRRFAETLFLNKLVAGKIDFYEYISSVAQTTSKTITRNGVKQPGSSSSTITTNTTTYYIARNDSFNLAFAKPRVLSSFRKKDLENYFADDLSVLDKVEKKFSYKEFIAFLKEYNSK